MELLDALPANNYLKNLRRKFSMPGQHEVAKQKYEKIDIL
jgi:hypothetical protein